MERNPFDGLGRAPGEQCQTWRRAVERETKKLGKCWRELKLAETPGLRTRRREEEKKRREKNDCSITWLFISLEYFKKRLGNMLSLCNIINIKLKKASNLCAHYTIYVNIF